MFGVVSWEITPPASLSHCNSSHDFDVPTLTEKVLGYRLPLQRLADWVRGSAAGGEVVEQDAQGRPLRVRLEDWRIEYDYEGDDPEAPPSRLFAERIGSFELRLRIERWTALPEGR